MYKICIGILWCSIRLWALYFGSVQYKSVMQPCPWAHVTHADFPEDLLCFSWSWNTIVTGMISDWCAAGGLIIWCMWPYVKRLAPTFILHGWLCSGVFFVLTSKFTALYENKYLPYETYRGLLLGYLLAGCHSNRTTICIIFLPYITTRAGPPRCIERRKKRRCGEK